MRFVGKVRFYGVLRGVARRDCGDLAVRLGSALIFVCEAI